MIPPKPKSRAGRVSLWRYARLFRRDILSAQPERLYRAWMAEFRTPFFRSFLVNQPDLVATILRERPRDFPKSERVIEGLRPLLGHSVFVTNGAVWDRQRRIIDPAFDRGRLKDVFPAMQDALSGALDRMDGLAGQGPVEMEAFASHAAADVIFRTLFSLPIEDALAAEVFSLFRAHQRSQPILNLGAFAPLPRWAPRFHRRRTRATARRIRALITEVTERRRRDIALGRAPDDLATKIMTTIDPVTGRGFDTEEMVDQVAIFFLAGHETSASALAWALYLLAASPEWQDKVAQEAAAEQGAGFDAVARLRRARDVFRETLRLYPPVPMMVRTATKPERFRDRVVPPGSPLVLSPWHLHRHARLWDQPDAFDPGRWSTENGKARQRDAFIPFSAGARVCPGAGFAMVEGPLFLARLVERFRFQPQAGAPPMPQAHLTVRAKDGIWLEVAHRNPP